MLPAQWNERNTAATVRSQRFRYDWAELALFTFSRMMASSLYSQQDRDLTVARIPCQIQALKLRNHWANPLCATVSEEHRQSHRSVG